jgi:hypothetical protein
VRQVDLLRERMIKPGKCGHVYERVWLVGCRGIV